MEVLQYVFLTILLLCAVAIVVAVTVAKTSEDGLSGTIVGGNDTYYGKDKASKTGRKLFLFTMIASLVFVVSVLVIYIMQPDYSNVSADWQSAVQNFGDALK